MKTSDVDILIIPGWSDSGPDHWQSRWVRNLKTARKVEQDNWVEPECEGLDRPHPRQHRREQPERRARRA